MPSLLDYNNLGNNLYSVDKIVGKVPGLLGDIRSSLSGAVADTGAILSGRRQIEDNLLFGTPASRQGAMQQVNAEAMARQQQEAVVRAEEQKKMQAAAQAEQEAMIAAAAAQQAQQAGMAALGGQPNENTTLGQVQAAETASKRAALEVKHQAEAAKGAEAIVKAGGTEKDLEGWAKFTDEFDLTTIGIALLASNDGSSNVVANLGQALMLGRQASEFRKDKIAAGQAAGRKEQREIAKENRAAFKTENEVNTSVFNANINAADKEDAARSRALRDRNDTSRTAASWANAYTNRLKASAESSGMDWESTVKPSTQAYVKSAAKKAGIKLSEFGDLSEEEVVNMMAAAAETELKGNPEAGKNPMGTADKAVQFFMRDFKENGFMLGTNYKRK